MLFMLLVPAWAMMKDIPRWIKSDQPNWLVIVIGSITLLVELWMIIEAWLLWPKVKGVMELTEKDLAEEKKRSQASSP